MEFLLIQSSSLILIYFLYDEKTYEKFGWPKLFTAVGKPTKKGPSFPMKTAQFKLVSVLWYDVISRSYLSPQEIINTFCRISTKKSLW